MTTQSWRVQEFMTTSYSDAHTWIKAAVIFFDLIGNKSVIIESKTPSRLYDDYKPGAERTPTHNALFTRQPWRRDKSRSNAVLNETPWRKSWAQLCSCIFLLKGLFCQRIRSHFLYVCFHWHFTWLKKCSDLIC